MLLTLTSAPGCGGPEPRPLAPRAQRLGQSNTSDRPPLERGEIPRARSLLIPRPVVEETPGGLTARVQLDGELEDQEILWTGTGVTLVDSQGTNASFRRTGDSWRVHAQLLHGDRVVDEGEVSGGGAPRIAAGRDRAVVEGAVPGSGALEVHGGRSLERLEPGDTISVRWVRPDGATSPWSSATAGGLPGAPSRMLALDPKACADPDFPRRSGSAHVTCSDSADPPVLDSWLSATASAPIPIADLPVRSGRSKAETPLPRTAAVSQGPARRLIWTADQVGTWMPGEATSNPLGRRAIRGRPASDGRSVVFAGPDRLEVGQLGGSQRFQVPARPVDGEHHGPVVGDCVAAVEGPVGHESLLLHHVARHRGATIAAARPRLPLLSGPWLSWTDEAAVRALPTEGGLAWTWPLQPAEGLPAALDDWLVVALRPGGLAALHLPTGLAIDLESGDRLAELRGAGAGAMTTWLREPGEAGQLAEWRAAYRIFEEDGPAAAGEALTRLAGGHGGSHGRLADGATRWIELDPGLDAWFVDIWVGPGQGGVPPTVTQGDRRLPAGGLIAEPAEQSPGHWVELARTLVSSGRGWEDRRVRITWSGGAAGTFVDAVRLRPVTEER